MRRRLESWKGSGQAGDHQNPLERSKSRGRRRCSRTQPRAPGPCQHGFRLSSTRERPRDGPPTERAGSWPRRPPARCLEDARPLNVIPLRAPRDSPRGALISRNVAAASASFLARESPAVRARRANFRPSPPLCLTRRGSRQEVRFCDAPPVVRLPDAADRGDAYFSSNNAPRLNKSHCVCWCLRRRNNTTTHK